MPRILPSVLLLTTVLAAQSPHNLPDPSDPTGSSLAGLTLGNNPDCNGIPRFWNWPLQPNACYRATVLGILGERELHGARKPFSYVTGHADPATGREFALLSANNALVIIDADRISETGPTRHRPQYWVMHDATPAVHRGTASFGEYVYESNAFRPSLRVFHIDVGAGANPTLTVTQQPDVPTVIHNSYRLTVDRERGHLYVPGFNGLRIYDINGVNAASPQLLAVWRGWTWPGNTMPAFDVHLQRDGGITRAVVSEYLTFGITHISILDVTALPSGSPAVDPWTPANWCSFEASQPTSGAAHSAWMNDDNTLLYSSVGDAATLVYDMQGFAFYNANRRLTVFEIPPRVMQAGTNPPVPLVYPEAPLHHMGMLGLGMTGYVSSWQEGLRIYDMRPSATNPNEALAFVDTSYTSSFQQYGGTGWSYPHPGAFSAYRSQDSGVIYVSDGDNGLFFVRLNVGHMHRYGKGTAEMHNGQLRVPRIVAAEAPPRAHTPAALDLDQRVTIENLVPGRVVMLIAATDGVTAPTPFPTATSSCSHYLGGIISQPLFVTADANGKAAIALPPVLPAQFRLFLQAFAFAPGTVDCVAATRGTWFGLAEPQ